MSGLFASLGLASRSLAAAQLGLDVTGQNIANVNTPGYTRRTVALGENAPTDALSGGNGVSVTGILAARDQFVARRLWSELQGSGYDAAMLQGLEEIETAVGLPGESLDASLAAFFDSFATLADDPTSATARQGVILQGQTLARDFQALSARIDAAAANADAAVVSGIDEVNRLAAEVAELNEAILANGSDVETLRDRRDVAVSRLSELAGVSLVRTSNGNVDLVVGAGRPLVIGVTAYALTAVPGGAAGYSNIVSGGFDITAELPSGTLGGLLQLRDTVIPEYASRLDQLAYDIASEVNAIHQTGYDATGAAAGAFFSPLAGVAGAAASIVVDSTLAADQALVGASGTGMAGDNQIARAIAGLRDANVTLGDTATPAGGWANFVYRIGASVSAQRTAVDRHDDLRTQLERIRDQASGVSLDEEAANLIRFQRAYQANARYFTAIVDTLDVLLNMVP
ncbi:MAG: flagellar hook-associated protein FlgK [Acidobacteria bacterium]|nr:flagellar hook-associated protein FlgK [Acidobacteriota bacterium]